MIQVGQVFRNQVQEYRYIAFLESTYFIKTIRPFSKGKNGGTQENA